MPMNKNNERDSQAGGNSAEKVKTGSEACIDIKKLNLYYSKDIHALRDISLSIPRNKVTAFIGPSGCGKSSLLRCFNRMNDLIDDCHIKGKIRIDGDDIYDKRIDVSDLRRRVGMVFQKPNPFPKSVYENVAYGLRIQGINSRRILDEVVEDALRAAALWDEVKDRLDDSALELSGGQQQRLVIARTIAVEPEVLLLDEPASSLDPISTLRIEELINELRASYSILIVTHNMQQAVRVSDMTAFFNAEAVEGGSGKVGYLVEFNETEKIFNSPAQQITQDYISGRFG